MSIITAVTVPKEQNEVFKVLLNQFNQIHQPLKLKYHHFLGLKMLNYSMCRKHDKKKVVYFLAICNLSAAIKIRKSEYKFKMATILRDETGRRGGEGD